MAGTSRFCVAVFLCVVSMGGLAAPDSHGQTRLMVNAGDLPRSGFSSALTDELPPGQYGGYQYQGPFPRSRLDRGLQYADPPAEEAASSGDVSHAAESIWDDAELQPTLYPLSEPSYGEIDGDPRSAGDAAPHWAPPILPSPHNTAAAPVDGWGLSAGIPADVTYVVGSGDGETLGITSVTAGAIVESPRLPGVSLRPLFGAHFPHGPAQADLPGQVFDASVEARMYWPFRDHIIGEFALAPGIFSDFKNTSGDALRIVGRGVGYYLWSTNLKFAAGVTYLDRVDIQLLPIFGVIWTPTPDHRFDLVFPQPRIARRFRKDDNHERWIYLSGELGGGSWAIQRSTGLDDVVTYRDLRLITGIEWKYANKRSWRVEGGYVFGRELEYSSNIGNFDPASTTMIRAALVY